MVQPGSDVKQHHCAVRRDLGDGVVAKRPDDGAVARDDVGPLEAAAPQRDRRQVSIAAAARRQRHHKITIQ